MPVRFTALDAADRSRALALARSLRAGGVRVESVDGTTVLIRAEDHDRAEAVLRALDDPPGSEPH